MNVNTITGVSRCIINEQVSQPAKIFDTSIARNPAFANSLRSFKVSLP